MKSNPRTWDWLVQNSKFKDQELNLQIKKTMKNIIQCQRADSQNPNPVINTQEAIKRNEINLTANSAAAHRSKSRKYLEIMGKHQVIKSTERLLDFRLTMKEIVDFKNGKPYKDTPEEIGLPNDTKMS